MDAKEVLAVMDREIAELGLWGSMQGPDSESYKACERLHKARTAVAEAYERLSALERECEGLRADAAEGLLREAREMANNWPGIAYSDDLTARIDAALAQQPTTLEKE
jgi:hypothetical protein